MKIAKSINNNATIPSLPSILAFVDGHGYNLTL
jgi:hypothetical protein